MATPTTLPASFTSGQVLTAAQMNNLRGGFRTLQWNTVTETVNQATASTTFVDLTNSSVSITPQATSNKIYLSFTAQTSASASGQRTYFQFVRGSTALFEEIQFEISGSFSTGGVFAGSFLDAPSSTSAQTYKIQIRTAAGTLTVVNWAFTVAEISL